MFLQSPDWAIVMCLLSIKMTSQQRSPLYSCYISRPVASSPPRNPGVPSRRLKIVFSASKLPSFARPATGTRQRLRWQHYIQLSPRPQSLYSPLNTPVLLSRYIKKHCNISAVIRGIIRCAILDSGYSIHSHVPFSVLKGGHQVQSSFILVSIWNDINLD